MQQKKSIVSIQDLLEQVKKTRLQPSPAVTLIYLDKQKRVMQQNTHPVTTEKTTKKIHLTTREIFLPALRQQAYFLAILQHRISGSLQPTNIHLTQVRILEKTGSYLGVCLLDFILISTKNHFSFRENGLLLPLEQSG